MEPLGARTQGSPGARPLPRPKSVPARCSVASGSRPARLPDPRGRSGRSPSGLCALLPAGAAGAGPVEEGGHPRGWSGAQTLGPAPCRLHRTPARPPVGRWVPGWGGRRDPGGAAGGGRRRRPPCPPRPGDWSPPQLPRRLGPPGSPCWLPEGLSGAAASEQPAREGRRQAEQRRAEPSRAGAADAEPRAPAARGLRRRGPPGAWPGPAGEQRPPEPGRGSGPAPPPPRSARASRGGRKATGPGGGQRRALDGVPRRALPGGPRKQPPPQPLLGEDRGGGVRHGEGRRGGASAGGPPGPLAHRPRPFSAPGHPSRPAGQPRGGPRPRSGGALGAGGAGGEPLAPEPAVMRRRLPIPRLACRGHGSEKALTGRVEM